MDDKAPQMPPPDERPQRAEDPVPDPHRTEPVPAAEEGMRPGADPAVRPSQDEEVGPVEGLLKASGAEASQEAAQVAGGEEVGDEALLAQMGVEDENVEAGQLLGLVAAVLASIVALIIVLIYLFYIPYRTQTGQEAAGQAQTTDLDIVETEGLAKLGTEASREDSTYTVPISRAMGLVVAGYGSGDAASATAASLPNSRQDWNTLPVMRGMGEAVQSVDRADIEPRFDDPALRLGVVGDAPEEVGVDIEAVPTVIVVDDDAVDSIE